MLLVLLVRVFFHIITLMLFLFSTVLLGTPIHVLMSSNRKIRGHTAVIVGHFASINGELYDLKIENTLAHWPTRLLAFMDTINCLTEFKNSVGLFEPMFYYLIFVSNAMIHSQKKGFFNSSSEGSKILPRTFCNLKQAKESPNYTQLWRTIKGSSFSCEEPVKILHRKWY